MRYAIAIIYFAGLVVVGVLVSRGLQQYALYLFNRLYRNDQTVKQLENLAAYAITETASQDGKVGGPVVIATITPEQGYVHVPGATCGPFLLIMKAGARGFGKAFFWRNEMTKQKEIKQPTADEQPRLPSEEKTTLYYVQLSSGFVATGPEVYPQPSDSLFNNSLYYVPPNVT